MNDQFTELKNACTFIIVRHGETEWNVKHLLQGHADSPLTPTGISQAEAVAKELRNETFDLAFSSDLLRAKRTAEIIAMEHNLTVTATKALRERYLGKLEGQPSELLRKFDVLLEKMDDQARFTHSIDDDIESDEELVFRLLTCIREIAILNPGKRILIATHGGAMTALLIHLGYFSYRTIPRNAVQNTARFELFSDGTECIIGARKGIADPIPQSGT